MIKKAVELGLAGVSWIAFCFLVMGIVLLAVAWFLDEGLGS